MMKNTIWFRLIRIALLVYLGVLMVIMALERFLVYPAPPRTAGNWNAASFDAEDVEFLSTDGTPLHGWYVQHPDAVGNLLFCHGNGEHLGYLGNRLPQLAQDLRVNVFAFDYRGYGKSGGKAHESGLLADGEAAQRWLAERSGVPVDEVLLYGQSLGGGVAVHLASHWGTRGLIVERTFHSMVDIGAAQFPWLPVRWVMRNRYPSERRIANYRGPLLQLHGEADTLVPIESGRRLFDACPSDNKSFISIPGMTHNDPTPKEFLDRAAQLVETQVLAKE